MPRRPISPGPRAGGGNKTGEGRWRVSSPPGAGVHLGIYTQVPTYPPFPCYRLPVPGLYACHPRLVNGYDGGK